MYYWVHQLWPAAQWQTRAIIYISQEIWMCTRACVYIYLIGRCNVHGHTTLQHINHFGQNGISCTQLGGKERYSIGFCSNCQLGSEGNTLFQDLNSSSIWGEYIFRLLKESCHNISTSATRVGYIYTVTDNDIKYSNLFP